MENLKDVSETSHEEICFKPLLRFEEFNSEWELIKLNEFLEFINTNLLSRSKLNFEKRSLKNIHYGDIHTKFPTLVDCSVEKIPYICPNIDISKFKDEQYCKNGDLIIADASEDYENIGKAVELINVNEKIVSGLHTILARYKLNKTALGFKGYLFLNESLRKNIKIIANGVSVLGISKNNLAKLEVKLPSFEEQNKIANFLSLIDKKIILLEKKHKNYEKIKKYFLEKIFLENNNFYSENNLGELVEIYGRIGFRGYTVDDLVEKGEGALTIGGKHISKDYKLDLSNPEYLSWEKYDESPEIKVKNNDILFIKTASVGKLCIIENLAEPATINPQIVVLKNIKINNKYLYYYMCSTIFQKEIHKIKSTTGIPTITQKEMKNISIKYHNSQKQENIVKFLSSFDCKIDLIHKELNLIKEIKKGLLQKMFV